MLGINGMRVDVIFFKGKNSEMKLKRQSMRVIFNIFSIFLVFVLSSCEIGRQAGIKPEDGFIVHKGTAIHDGPDIQYELNAGGTNFCCSVTLDLKNPLDKPLMIDLTKAEITSSCKDTNNVTFFMVKAPWATNFNKIDDGPHGAKYTRVSNPESLTLNRGEVVRLGFTRDRWYDKCLPYHFTLPLADGKVIHATFESINIK